MRDIVTSLQSFLDKLRRGDLIEVTTVRREETPDGPLHVRDKRIVDLDKDDEWQS